MRLALWLCAVCTITAHTVLETLYAESIESPVVRPSRECVPPPRNDIAIACSDSAFTGRHTQRKRKVAHLFLFGFELDTLEVMLHEESDVVDRFFLVESMHAHKFGATKTLIWESVMRRFRAFKDKVVHIVVDDARSRAATLRSNNDRASWDGLHNMMEEGVQAVLSWQAASSPEERFAPEDLLIIGDVDEVMSRDALSRIVSCEMKHDVTTGALWMPMGNVSRAFRTDWPVFDRMYSFAQPYIYAFSSEMGDPSFRVPNLRNASDASDNGPTSSRPPPPPIDRPAPFHSQPDPSSLFESPAQNSQGSHEAPSSRVCAPGRACSLPGGVPVRRGGAPWRRLSGLERLRGRHASCLHRAGPPAVLGVYLLRAVPPSPDRDSPTHHPLPRLSPSA